MRSRIISSIYDFETYRLKTQITQKFQIDHENLLGLETWPHEL